MAMNNDLVPNLAMRKAVKRSAMVANDIERAVLADEKAPVMETIQVQAPAVPKAPQEPTLEIGSIYTTQPRSAVAPVVETAPRAAVAASPSSAPSISAPLSRDEIIKLASAHGLKFEGAKKVFVKHTYSVTPESKSLFKKYCDSLALNMQDAMEEALQDFFKKHGLEYSRIVDAKKQR